MVKLIDLTGMTFGRLLVLREADRHPKDNSRQWLTMCSCKKITIVQQRSLRDGSRKSCGCLWDERNKVDLIGQTFGFLTVVEKSPRNDGDNITWVCKCHCGVIVTVSTSLLKTGHSRSCGCLQRSIIGNLNKTHGMSKTPTYISWKSMLTRCYNENILEYKDYGGRGIKVCDRWRYSFENFYIDMGIRPGLDYSLDRKDVNGNYEPNNCRWLDKLSQTRNTRFQLNPMNGIRKTASGKFRAAIGVNNSYKELGTFLTIEEAQEARRNAETKYWS